MRVSAKYLIALALTSLVIVSDQWSKQEVLAYFASAPQPFAELTSFFNLVLVHNYGISFGMLASHNQPLALTALSAIVSCVLLVWLVRSPSLLIACALSLVVGGAVGNSYDRLTLGAVVDFLDFHAFGYHWPAFNIADSAIFIGVVLLCAHSMFIESKKPLT